MPNHERLIPTHIGGEIESPPEPKTKKSAKEPTPELTPEERFAQRAEMLHEAPRLEGRLQGYLEKAGKTVPENVNLSLVAIEEFQRYVKEAQDLRRVIQNTMHHTEKAKAWIPYHRKMQQIKEYLTLGASFEAAYREYIRNRGEYIHFKSTLAEIRQLRGSLNEPSFAGVEDEDFLPGVEKKKPKDKRKKPVHSYSRLEALMHESRLDTDDQQDQEVLLEGLETIFPADSKEYIELAAQISGSDKSEHGALRSKKDVTNEIAKLNERVNELWDNPMVRYFSSVAELEKLMRDYHSGEAVLENQSVIKNLNKLYEWEQQHQNTTIGGVLVGPPGVGKTTLVRHYLEAMKRPEFAYIDLSEDVTRYLLYGSKSIEFKNPSDFYITLSSNLDQIKSEEDIIRFVAENTKTLSDTFGVKGEEATVVFLEQLQETLEKGAQAESLDKDTKLRIQTVMTQIKGMIQKTFRKELSSEFSHVVKRNGWRDGMVIAALRRGESVIFDEFNKNKNWSLIYSLMTAEPGRDWYFADNDEHIKIPDHWRMYFTANIGTRHGGFAVPEALASRGAGKIIEVDYPTPREELLTALTSMSNPEGDFLRSNDDLAKLFILVHDVFPGMRKYLEDKKQTIPISYRTIRDIADKLVMKRDPKSKKPVFQPSDKSFDEAIYEVFIDASSAYEDKEPPKEWAKTLTSVGLLLDDRVKDRVVKWIGEADYDERRKKFEGMKDDFAQVVAKIKGMTRNMSADMAIPDQTNF